VGRTGIEPVTLGFRLRKLVADDELLRRRAAGEALRQLAADYDVVHTTLCRYFTRPEVKEQLKEAGKQLRAERRSLAARRAAERRLELRVRRKAQEQAALEREREHRYQAEIAKWNADRPAGGAYASWMHDRYEPELRLASDRHSTYDREALEVVAAGGGTQALLAATELPTLEIATHQIDPVILAQVFDNEAFERAQHHPVTLAWWPRLRRLVPDSELLRRRAAGEPLRTLAPDYAVAHTTLARFFAQPKIKRQLRETAQQLRAERPARRGRRPSTRRHDLGPAGIP
jgi:hypothetical protein